MHRKTSRILTITCHWLSLFEILSFPGGAVVKNPPARAGDLRDTDSVPGSERSPGEGNGNPFQYSYLGNPMDKQQDFWKELVLFFIKEYTCPWPNGPQR